MSIKSMIVSIILVVVIGGGLAVFGGYFGQNDDQDWQVLQSPFGKMDVRTDSGIYQKRFATAWTYPKVQRVYFSSDVREGSKQDESCKVVFSDKGTASFSTMVLYRSPYMLSGLSIPDIDANGQQPRGLKEGAVANFHRLCKGDITVADQTVLARVKEYSRIVASEYNASQSVDNQDEFIYAIRKALKEDVTLTAYGIDVEEVTLSDITFDDKTIEQFEKQQEAILASKEAEAKKVQYDMEKLATEADYGQKIAEQKGIAEMDKMKQVTEAERDAELAIIAAQKAVDVETLAKEEALVIANKALEVASVDKEAALVDASKGLEVATIAALEAEQAKIAVISEAEGKEQAIALSGAITEKEEVLAKIDAQRDVNVAQYISQMQSPTTLIIGGKDMGQSGHFNSLMSYGMSQQFGIIPANPDAMPVKITK